MPKRSIGTLKNVTVDNDAFEAIMRKPIAPPIRQDYLKPKRKTRKRKPRA
jgi:hypothetical protein